MLRRSYTRFTLSTHRPYITVESSSDSADTDLRSAGKVHDNVEAPVQRGVDHPGAAAEAAGRDHGDTGRLFECDS